jgi:hypothetical protein
MCNNNYTTMPNACGTRHFNVGVGCEYVIRIVSCPYKIVKNATVKGGGGVKLEDKNSEIALDLDQVRLSIVRVAKRRDRARRFPALLHLARPIPRSSLKFPLSFRLLAMIVGPSLTLGRHKLQHLLGLF